MIFHNDIKLDTEMNGSVDTYVTSAERIDCVCLSQREPAVSAVQKKKKKICGISGRDLSSGLGSLTPAASRPSSQSPIRPTRQRFHRTLSPCGSSRTRTQNWSLCTESRMLENFETVSVTMRPQIFSGACWVRPHIA